MSDKKESVDTTIKMVTATIDKHYHGIITSLQSQLEREQKCVELAFEALEYQKRAWQWFKTSCHVVEKGLFVKLIEDDRILDTAKDNQNKIIEALTKIKSLREGETK